MIIEWIRLIVNKIKMGWEVWNNEQAHINEKLKLIDGILSPEEQKMLQDFSLEDFAKLQTEHMTDFPERSLKRIQEIENNWWNIPENIKNNTEEIAILQLYMKLFYGSSWKEKYKNIKIDGNSESLKKVLNIKEKPKTSIQEYIESWISLNKITLEEYNTLEEKKWIIVMWKMVLSQLVQWGKLNKLLPNEESIKRFQLFLKMEKEGSPYQKYLKLNNNKVYKANKILIDGKLESIDEERNNKKKQREILLDLWSVYISYLEKLNKEIPWDLSGWIKKAHKELSLLRYMDILKLDLAEKTKIIFFNPQKYYSKSIQNQKYSVWQDSIFKIHDYHSYIINPLLLGNYSSEISIRWIKKEFYNILEKQDKNDANNSNFIFNRSYDSTKSILHSTSDEVADELREPNSLLPQNSTNKNTVQKDRLILKKTWDQIKLELVYLKSSKGVIQKLFANPQNTEIYIIQELNKLEIDSDSNYKLDENQIIEDIIKEVNNLRDKKEDTIKITMSNLRNEYEALKKDKSNLWVEWLNRYNELYAILNFQWELKNEIEDLFNQSIGNLAIQMFKESITYQHLNHNITTIKKLWKNTYSHRFARYSWAWSYVSNTNSQRWSTALQVGLSVAIIWFWFRNWLAKIGKGIFKKFKRSKLSSTKQMNLVQNKNKSSLIIKEIKQSNDYTSVADTSKRLKKMNILSNSQIKKIKKNMYKLNDELNENFEKELKKVHNKINANKKFSALIENMSYSDKDNFIQRNTILNLQRKNINVNISRTIEEVSGQKLSSLQKRNLFKEVKSINHWKRATIVGTNWLSQNINSTKTIDTLAENTDHSLGTDISNTTTANELNAAKNEKSNEKLVENRNIKQKLANDPLNPAPLKESA